ncbi:hypothetical protein CK203_115155 [Vitis vinifera]|uniref:Uncharacterized protein n=1 Tax=Vitis vinifera TaxID=29760 RepID=A0A438C9M7_VITVI|nr:hypothetical protein CK203_115155 [Vitis vinifera]
MEATPEDRHNQHAPEKKINTYRSMRTKHPPLMSAPSCTVPPIEQLTIRPHIVPLLPTFHGMESENPYAHIKDFEEDISGACSHKIDNLQYSISRLTNLNTVQEKGKFPSQPHQNPKGIHEVESHDGESSQVRDVKALITLRSGKKIELPTPKPHVKKEEEEEETEKMEEIKGKKKDNNEGKEDHDSTVNATPKKVLIKGDVMKKHTPPPFLKLCMGKRESEMH